MNLPFLSSFVCGPAFLRRRDIPRLPFLRAAANQDHKEVAILAKVNSITGPEIDPVFKDTVTNALDLRYVSLFHTRKRDGHLGGCRGVKSFQPVGEPFVPVFVNVAADLDRPRFMVTIVLPYVKLPVTFA